MNRYVALIDRKSLQSRLMNFSREIQQLFFIPQFKTNPSGSATWSFTAGVFREGINITAQSFEATPHLGEPDETGRYVVGSDGILDLKATPPVITPFAGLPGVEDHTDVELDVSGRYLLFRNHDSKLGELVISIRSVRTPAGEILKLIVPSNHGSSKARVISGTNKLVLEMDSSRSRLGVFELDIPSLAKDLAAGPGQP